MPVIPPNASSTNELTEVFTTYAQLTAHKGKQLLTLLEEDDLMMALIAAVANRGRELCTEAGVSPRPLPAVAKMMVHDAMRGSTTWVETDPNYDAWDKLDQVVITINTDNV